MKKQVTDWAVAGLGALGVVLTALPILPSNENWVRVWEFPRAQIAVLLFAVLVTGGFTWRRRSWGGRILLVAVLAALTYQAWRIWPYTPLHGIEVIQVAECPPQSRVSVLVANVLMGNRHADRLLTMVRDQRPDIVLLVETDVWWDDHLATLMDDYPFAVRHPQADSYGMHLFSKMPLIDPQVRFLIEDYVPSIQTEVQLPSGAVIEFYGVHPKPPPRQDTERRDAELLMVGTSVRRQTAPAIVAGDLNDVAWSRTTRLFQEISGLLDPRVGRGLFATFNANWPLLKWPLDHVFFEQSFALMLLEVMPDIGSDHYPLRIDLCHGAIAKPFQEEPVADPDALRRAREAIEEGRPGRD